MEILLHPRNKRSAVLVDQISHGSWTDAGRASPGSVVPAADDHDPEERGQVLSLGTGRQLVCDELGPLLFMRKRRPDMPVSELGGGALLGLGSRALFRGVCRRGHRGRAPEKVEEEALRFPCLPRRRPRCTTGRYILLDISLRPLGDRSSSASQSRWAAPREQALLRRGPRPQNLPKSERWRFVAY